MNRAEFEADVRRQGYEVCEGETKPVEHRPTRVHGFDARHFVLDGALTLVRGDDSQTFGPGETCSLSVGTRHQELRAPAQAASA